MPAITFKPRVKETSTTTGTGNITLAGAVVGYQSFDDAFAVTDDYFYYCIEGVDGSGVPTGQWEEGIGHLSASTTLVRDTLLASSTGSAVSFSAGTKNVFCTVAANHFRQSAILASDVTATSNATLANVTGLKINNLIAGRKYQITANFYLNSISFGGGWQIDFAGGTATGTSVTGHAIGKNVPNDFVLAATITSLSTVVFTDLDDWTPLIIVFGIEVNAGGSLIPRFAQYASNADASKLAALSSIEALEI